MILFIFMCVCWTISTIKSLECGLSTNQNQEDIKRYTSVCMATASNKNVQFGKNTSNNGQSFENSYDDDDSQSSLEEAVGSSIIPQPKLNPVKIHNSSAKNDNLNDTEITNDCVVQCVLKRLGMVDSSGYPDHARISENLTKGVENRELKDFLQDSTDECFQMMEQDEQADPCYFSTQFIKCLAERGKSNCGDWPMTDLSFTQLF